jgi:CheY-like chemotaxis protein
MQEWILIIDDDRDDCDFLKENLIEVGLKITIDFAHDGPAALKLLESRRENQPKLIILDVNMPFMNGLIVLAKLNVGYNIPVILYTTACNDVLIREAKAFGAIDCVKKGTSYSDNIKFAKSVFDLVVTSTHGEFGLGVRKFLEK